MVNKKYSISVCTTSNFENALTCKKRIQKNSKFDVFIVKEKSNKFVTYLGLFDTNSLTNKAIKLSSNYVKDQKPFAKEITQNIINQLNLNLSFIESNQNTNIKIIQKEKFNTELSKFEEIFIEVDSKINTMTVKAKLNNEFTILNRYKVSTGKNNIKKPKGLGKISEIALNPTWYPTQDTLNSFRKKGIYLPAAVPGGHRLNYMGAAKLNLTHTVNGLQTFRIHGTLNENTIGTNESAGCIRMKNSEVVQLANLLKDFTKYKTLDNVQVYLK